MIDTLGQLAAALSDRYVVERLIGEGGMATVYLARDVRHHRKVALKVLKPDLGAIVGVERFLSEIEVTANLQHPNLLPLFDSGQVDGLLFYVMPYVEGESLRAKLEREKQLSVDDTVRIATSVASALDYAHRHGVIHRDLKPEYILLHDGQPLVADFGIALAVSNAGGNRITQTGLSLGTPQYMSPEQATGDRIIDARSDIYSLGAMTYEMLTGEAPHTGATSQAIIARVLTEKPRAIRSSRPNVPPHVEATIEQALEKLAPDRFATAKEFSEALSGRVVLAASTSFVGSGQSGGFTRREKMLATAFAFASIAVIALGLKALRPVETGDAAPDFHFAFETPSSRGLAQVSVSPNGQYIIFSGPDESGRPILWMRSLDSPETAPLRGTEEAFVAAWSPDSRQIAFSANERVRRMTIPGGSALTVADVGNNIAWIGDSALAYVAGGELHRVLTSGGIATKVPAKGMEGKPWRSILSLPGGTHLLAVVREAGTNGLYVIPLDGRTPVRVGEAQSRVSFAEPDQLLFVIDETLYAQRFNLQKFALEGDPVRVAESVLQNLGPAAAGFGVSRNGVLAYRRVYAQTGRQLRWYSRSGQPLDTLGPRMRLAEVRLSPDGRRVAMTAVTTSGRGVRGVWTVDLSSRIASRVTSDTTEINGFSWSADSRALYLGGRSAPIWRRMLGSSTDSLVYRVPGGVGVVEDQLADGSALMIVEPDSLLILRLDGSNTSTRHKTPRRFDEPRISPDGKLIAYHAQEFDEPHVFIANFPAFDNQRQISATSGLQPIWKGDGRELYFLDALGKVMVAARKTGAGDAFEAPRALFQSPIPLPSRGNGQWDVTNDGQRFLFVAPVNGESAPVPTIEVLHDWRKVLPKR